MWVVTMKLLLLTALGICGTLHARLIEKNTESVIVETQTPQLPPRIRLTRDTSEENTLTDFSKEYNGQSLEFVQSYNRKTREYYKPRPKSNPNITIRKPRESKEKEGKPKNISAVAPSFKPKVILVKKPIPKYSEIDYEDDFQAKVSESSVRVANSGEHEDEDFNVDDYDFDVNHDEFIGRGKPLEPRVKHKEGNEQRHRSHPKPALKVLPEIKIQSKVVVPSVKPTSNKKERAALAPRELKEKKDDDYYDDTTTIKTTEKDKKDSDELADDEDESKEVDSKMPSRLARSPWRNFKLDEKKSNAKSKLLAALPMFPILNYKQIECSRLVNQPTAN